MKKMLCSILLMLVLLAGCGEKTIGRAEELQERYAQLASYETDVRAVVPREEETFSCTLRLTSEGESVRAEVLAPEELAGIAAEMTGEALALLYDGMILDALSLSPRVSALSCAPLLLKEFPEAYLESCGSETLSGRETLRADFSITLAEETFSCALFFEESGAPVYGEIAQDGKIIAAVEFTNFTFGDILSPDT